MSSAGDEDEELEEVEIEEDASANQVLADKLLRQDFADLMDDDKD